MSKRPGSAREHSARLRLRLSRRAARGLDERERVSKGGERKRIRVQISPARDASGAIVGVSTVEHDINFGPAEERRLILPPATVSQIGPLAGHST